MAKILTIDDREDNLVTLSAILKNLIPGCNIITALSGPEGIEKAKRESPDTILLDIKMPGMDGYEVCKRLKEDENTKHVPVIMISAIKTESKDRVMGFESGADAYLAKPIDEYVLVAQVKTALRIKKAEDRLRKQKDALEKTVLERTAELAKSNQQLKDEIKEHKQAEQHIEQQADFLNLVLESLTHPFYVIDAIDYSIKLANTAAHQGRLSKETTCYALAHRRDKPCGSSDHPCPLEIVKKTKQPTTVEHVNYDKNGNLKNVEIHAFPIFDKGGNVSQIIEYSMDITEKIRTEEALKESEDRFRQLFEYAPDGYYLTDLEGNFIDGNRAAEDLTGYKRKELIGKNFIEAGLLSVEQVSKAIELLKQNIEGKTTGPDEFTLKRKDGVEVMVEIRNLPTKIGDKNVILGIARDITERKRLEAKLQQAHKMEAIATLAGGIAHEFNNALTGVLGNIQLLEMDLHENKTVIEYTNAMKVSSQRMVNLTSQLLAYARGGRYQTKTIFLNDFVENTLPIIKPNIDPSIRLETDLPRGVSNVKTDPTQMQLVLSALLSNSSEAIDGEGRIRIITRNEEIDEEFSKSHPEINPGRYVCLTVEDDGKGMDKETLNKIFDPFYTTKFMGRGLGMAAVYGIVRNHDGWISVDSEQGKGTIVRIYLPAFEGKKEKVREIPSEAIELITGTGTILVIEDEETVMDVIRDILDKLGYRMLEARSGKEAIEMAGTFDGDIDLALLDIKLPDIWGDKVYPQLMEARPNLKVIVCTGYSIDGPAQTILDAGAQDFIQKPFTVETISAKLKKVMEGK